MTASVKEVLALARRIDEAEKRRVVAAEEKATLTAQLEALIGIGAEPATAEDQRKVLEDIQRRGLAASVAVPVSGVAPRAKRMPAIEPEPGAVP